MRNLILILSFGIFIASTSLIRADAQASEQAPHESGNKATNPDVFATVNGAPLSMNLYRFLVGSRAQGNTEMQSYTEGFDAEIQRQQAADDLIMTEVLSQQATRMGMHESEQVKVEMAMAEKTLLAQLYVKKLMDSIEIEESEIRRYYDQQREQAMYRFMIWQTSEQDRARDILRAVKAGKDSGVSEQDVIETPWLRDTDIAPEVNNIVQSLRLNEFAEKPISQDGLWKVVQVIDKQVMTKEPYEEAREIIRAELVSQKLDEKLEDLAAEASIVFNDEHANQAMK
jgi:hypothetical protein